MKPVVVDTNVVSYVLKDDPCAKRYRKHLTGRRLVVSFMTVAELERWALSKNWSPDRRSKMRDHLRRFVVYGFNHAICREWAAVVVDSEKIGAPITCSDAWIAATARFYRIPLVTNNPKHFRRVPELEVLTADAQSDTDNVSEN